MVNHRTAVQKGARENEFIYLLTLFGQSYTTDQQIARFEILTVKQICPLIGQIYRMKV